MPLAIVHEDADLIVLDKPPGLVVHRAPGNWSGTLLNGLLAHDRSLAHLPRAGIVHRLDADTSGLMVVARSLAAHVDLVRQLQERTVTREYWAVVHGRTAAGGTIERRWRVIRAIQCAFASAARPPPGAPARTGVALPTPTRRVGSPAVSTPVARTRFASTWSRSAIR